MDKLHALLKDALPIVGGCDWHDPKRCPICEAQGEEPLKPKLEARIAEYDAAAELGAELVKEASPSSSVTRSSSLRRLRRR